MSKVSFAAGLKGLKPEPKVEAPSPAPAKVEPPSRTGKVAIAAYFEPEVRKQLAIMAARQEKTQAALMAEALNMLFEHYGESAIARA